MDFDSWVTFTSEAIKAYLFIIVFWAIISLVGKWLFLYTAVKWGVKKALKEMDTDYM